MSRSSILHALALAVRPAELSTQQRESLRRRILELARAWAPEGTRTLRATDSEWIEIRPFVEMRELRRDEMSGLYTSLVRMRPGGVIPAHYHEREEECIVLEGEVQIGTYHLSAGDVHIATAGSWHEQVSTRRGVLVLLRGDDPRPARTE